MSNNEIEQLSDEQLDQVLQFAQGLYDNIGGYGGNFNPFGSNYSLLRTNNNPLKPTKETLEDALSKVPYDKQLVGRYSEFMQVWDAIYNKTLNYYKGLLSYDLSWVCTNAEGKDYQSKEYKDDLKRIRKFFDKFDYKNEFDKVTDEVLKKGASFLWFRDTQPIDQEIDISEKRSESFGLQIMPDNYCKIVGYTSSGLPLYDFDVDYFLHTDVDINLFAPSLIKKFRGAYNGTNKKYIPSQSVNNRNGVYASEWVQTSYKDGAFCVKWGLGNYRVVPPFASLMKSCLRTDEVEALKRDRDILGSYYLLSGTIQLMNNTKSEKANQFAITPQVLGKFLQMVTSGLTKNVKAVAMPLDETKGWQFQDYNLNLLSNHYKETSGQGASASELIYHTENLSQFAMQNAVEMDYAVIAPLYAQYANLLNIFVNRKTKKFKFRFTLTGLNRSWDRTTRIDNITKYADKGIILGSSQWASALGMNPCDFDRSMEEGFNSDFTDKLKLMLNVNTMKDGSDPSDGENKNNGDNENPKENSQTEDKGGRPSKGIAEKSDNTETSDNYK